MNDTYDIGKAFQAIEDELIASMIRNMRRHKLEEIKEDKQWTMWQAEQLKALEKYKKANQKKYGKQFRDINAQIEQLIRIAKEDGNMQQELTILNAIKKGFPAKRISKGATAEFFKLNERKLEALIKATTNDMEKAETAILRRANDQYRKAIFNAQVYANTGAGTYEKAVDMATKDMIASGLACVEYSNGARHKLSEYADMAIRTASKRAYLQGEGEKRQEWGISLVIVNKRGNPCPKCLPFCGKVLIDDVWSGGSKEDGDYPLMSKAIEHGLYHPRCKDSHTTYFKGISTADDTWTKEELEAIEKSNKEEAKQQYANRQQEKYERLAKYSLDNENQKLYKTRASEWENKSRIYTGKQLDQMSFSELQQLAKEKATEYYKSGISGISFGNANIEEVAEKLSKVGSKTSLKKDILSMQKKTKRSAKSSEKKQLEKVVKDDKIKLSNEDVRKKYVEEVLKIKDNIDSSLPFEEQAKQAFKARNKIRTEARNMMADEETRKKLDKEKPNITFEELVKSKMKRKNMTREEAIKDIYDTATKTNETVNRKLGIGGD